MQIASSHPHPYLLDQAGGICQVKEFSLIDGELNLTPATDKPLTGRYQLIYRCPNHRHTDIKRAVRSDGTQWTVAEPLSPEEDCDVCYPGPCN
jgi:hypothetical protein